MWILVEGENKSTAKGGCRFFQLFQAGQVVGVFEPFRRFTIIELLTGWYSGQRSVQPG
jgi:hypothetical protein